MYVFDGRAAAMRAEAELARSVSQLKEEGRVVKVAAILFQEDPGSRYYSEHKQFAAERVGISYELHPFSISQPAVQVIESIKSLNQDDSVTGIIIQKPTGTVWREYNQGDKADFALWWQQLYAAVSPEKDVDGLHPSNIEAIKEGTWREQGRVLPATCRAVLRIMDFPAFKENVSIDGKYLLIGKSDLLGQPLYHILKGQGRAVEMIGRDEFSKRMESGLQLKDADVIVTATGREFLVTGEMIKEGVALIDVGEPRPDIDQKSISKKAAFITPVPGGVGPLTVVSLLENAIELIYN